MTLRTLPHDMFFYVLKGRGEAEVAGRRHRLHSGICLHFRRGDFHEASHDPNFPLQVLVLHYSARIHHSLPLAEMMGFPDAFDFREDDWAKTLLWEASRLCTLMPLGWKPALDAITLSFLYRVINQHGDRCNPVHGRRLSDLSRVSKAMRLMREELHDPQSVEKYATLSHMSPPHFRRVFRRAIGLSPNEYLRQSRLQHAAYLLRHTRKTIEEISSQVGYREAAFFAKTFKSCMGMPPGAYRKKADFMD